MSPCFLCGISFNPKTYRAIGRRLAASHSPRYLVTYDPPHVMKKYNYKGLFLVTKLSVSMTGSGGKCERKTAYFFEINKLNRDMALEHCDPAFVEATALSRLATGERYQHLIVQASTFQNQHKSSVTTRRTQRNSNFFIDESDKETVTGSDSEPTSDSENVSDEQLDQSNR